MVDTVKAITNMHRNKTELKKIECLKTYECFHIYAEMKLNTELKTCTKLDFIFSVSSSEYRKYDTFVTSITWQNFNYTCTYTTMCVVYNLVIMKAIDGLFSETIERLFYKYQTTNYRFL